MSGYSKQWAREYILDPLTAPEPSQETGPGTSFYNPQRQLQSKSQSQSQSQSKRPASIDTRRSRSRDADIPTPPSSGSPSRSSFHPSNPFSRAQPTSPLASPPQSPSDDVAWPVFTARPHRRYPPVFDAAASPIGRSASVRLPPPPSHVQLRQHHRSASADRPHREHPGALPPRFPGDLSHRPLEMIKQQTRTANRSGRHRRGISDVDTIDALDTIGGTYHHGGPFDATLASRNVNAKYPPVEAVHDTNMEAIRATPREFIQDSLVRHMPLQGIASIPAGETDLSGKVMDFQEGADLMREEDAPGGPYKRWDGINYHPDDLKGKGEPSYTFEKEKAKGTAPEYEMQSGVNGDGILGPAPRSRPRSVSNADKATSSAYAVASPGDDAGESSASGLRRSNTTGKKLSDGLKRRFGSMRRKRDSTTVEQMY